MSKRCIKGVNDLATTHPEIAKEWYQPENGSLTPSDVTYGSGKKVKWKCPKGHIYSAAILHRTSGGTNCPICRIIIIMLFSPNINLLGNIHI